MAVPEFHRFLRPLLETAQDGKERHRSEYERAAIERFALTDEDLREPTAGGRRTRVADRVEWALAYLRKALLLENVARGQSRITARGTQYLAEAPAEISPKDLLRFPEFADFAKRTRSVAGGAGPSRVSKGVTDLADTPATPHDRIAAAHAEIEDALADELLERVKGMVPALFERLIVDLMLRLGYGGTAEGAGQTLGGTSDGGVDGVIWQDKLGLDLIYLQAKRWSDRSVGREIIQAFVGALSGKNASRGVFITTSSFTKEAREYASSVANHKLSLVDGRELARLMMQSGLGVTLQQRYDVKSVDQDYFQEE
ncbi:MAG TPA: restriction endonuclease [Chthonomonadales bacterium]|nr:restriction endonuclease [Chthonomonadales bacterium]